MHVLTHPLRKLALVALASLAAARTLHAQVPASVVDSIPGTTPATRMLVGADVQLALRTGDRGTPAPIHLILARATKARRGPRGTGVLPTRMRAEHAPARAFAASAMPIVERESGPRKGDTLVATLTGIDGTLAFVRLRDMGKKKPAYRVHLTTAAGTTTAVPDAAEAKMLVQFIGDLGERLDPAGTPDYARLYERDTEVDKPVVPAPGSCSPHYPESLRRSRTQGEVQAQFVVSSVGLADAATFKVLRSSHREFEGEVRTSLRCFRYLPAELRGRPVRMRVQQPFTFQIVGQ